MRMPPSLRRGRLAAVQALLTFAMALLLAIACHQSQGIAPRPDVGSPKTSFGGIYRVAVQPDVVPIPVHRLQRWTLHLETADGRPVDSVTISVDGGMPRHGHGLPTVPRVTRALGHGDHLVEGMKFNMGGWWVVKFAILGGMGRDSVVFNLSL